MTEFEQQFPSLKRIAVKWHVDKDSNIQMFDYETNQELKHPMNCYGCHEISRFCLDKQKVKEAIEKHTHDTDIGMATDGQAVLAELNIE